MTKKHFVAFAEYIRIDLVNQGKVAEARTAAEMIAYVAIRDNARFDKDRFFKACGLSQ